MNDEEERPRVIFDTTAVYQATLSPNGKAETNGLRLMSEGHIEVFMSNRLRAEYEQTLRSGLNVALTTDNPKVKERLRCLTQDFVESQLDRFDQQANRLVNPPQQVGFKRDPEDEHVLNLAVHVEADFIAAWDSDLRDLDRSPVWREYYPSIRIVPPQALRQEIELWYQQKLEQKQAHEQKQDRGPSHSW